ncbi:hypothetical protein Tco_1541268 [Tanacetum coccineum]
MAISSSSSSSSSNKEVQNCSKQCLESFKTLQKNIYDSEREKHSRARLEIQGYELALESLESRILGHEKNELAWGEKYEFQNYELKCREIKINNLKMELEKVVKERDELKVKIEKWEESSKGLNKLLNSQMSAKDKNGLGYGTQLDEMSNKSETDSEISMSVFEVRSSDEEITPANDRFSKADGYHTVPPPIIGNFLTPRADISFTGLDEYAIRKKIIESKTTEPRDNTSESKTSETVGKTNEVEKSKTKINRDKVIIEDWNSDDEDDVSEVNTVSHVKTNETQTSTDHLIKDCDFYAKKSQEPKLKIVVNTVQRVVKPVWDNAKRVNHQKISNKLKYPQARRTFVPSGVLTRTSLVNPVRPNGKRVVHTVSTARPISTVRPVSTARPFAPKIAQTGSAIRPIYPRIDNVRPRASYSPIKRTKAVVNTGKGNLEICLQDHAVVDSGCSSHMTGNKAYLSDYKDYSGGFVAFGSDLKGGNTEELVSTARPEVSTARPDIDAARKEDNMKEEKPKEKGVSIKDVDDSLRPARSILTLKPLPIIDPKDKGKWVLKESPVKKVKRSDLDTTHNATDAEIARLVHEKELAGMEREKEERQRQDQASVDYIASLYDEVQAKMDASEELAARLQMEERERDVHNRRKALYIKEQERDADFVPIGSERDEKMIDKMNKKAAGMDEEEVPEEPESTKVEVKQEGREENIRKRSGRRLKMKATKKSKRQKTDSDLEEEEQLRASLKIVPDEEEEIDYEVLGTRYPIVNWESAFYHTDRYGVPHDYYRVFRANGSSRYIKTFTEMVSRFDRLDFIELHSLVMQRFSTTTPEGIDLVLWGDLRIMFEETADDDIWKNQEKWIIKSWTFYENCGVHILALEDGTEIHMLAERRYPLIRETLERMMELRLTAESEGEAVFDLLRFIQKQIDEFGGQDGSEKDL